ncbi:MAG TPA: cyclic pyranopterin monophosphate synthase MoaC [Tenuifilaceae bacterium]|nr:cyclic pyranopterin monophosphate synthase MoaC [Tenuifilaceae bacterium]
MELSHTNSEGKAKMVDVSPKPNQVRRATATGFIRLKPETLSLISDNAMKKGDVLTVAEIAGIQAAKRTFELIPLCHNLLITKVDVEATIKGTGVAVTGTVKCVGQTGVEMEAITAVSVALLTIYDMCKAVDKEMEIGQIKLVEKTKKDI